MYQIVNDDSFILWIYHGKSMKCPQCSVHPSVECPCHESPCSYCTNWAGTGVGVSLPCVSSTLLPTRCHKGHRLGADPDVHAAPQHRGQAPAVHQVSRTKISFASKLTGVGDTAWTGSSLAEEGDAGCWLGMGWGNGSPLALALSHTLCFSLPVPAPSWRA